MKKNVTRWAAGISSAVMLASFSALSVPAFAAEYDAVQAEAYAASLSNENAQTVAKYLLDNGVSMEETEEMMGWYMDGQAIIESEQNAENGIAAAAANKDVDTGVAYYNGNAGRVAQTQHYGVLVINNPSVEAEVVLRLKWNTDKINYDSSQPHTMINGYSGESITYSISKGIASMRIRLDTDGRDSNIPLAAVSFPFTPIDPENELGIYDAFTISQSSDSLYGDGDTTKIEYHTYALGDFDHNGIVNKVDYTYLMNYLVLSFNGIFHYTDVGENIAYEVNMLAADTNEDGVVDLHDAIEMNSWGLY